MYSIPVRKIFSQDWNSFSIRKTIKTGMLGVLNNLLPRYELNKIEIVRVCRCTVIQPKRLQIVLSPPLSQLSWLIFWLLPGSKPES